ncbi:MAG: cytochrome c peroxidase [Acidobacteriota bacterium]
MKFAAMIGALVHPHPRKSRPLTVLIVAIAATLSQAPVSEAIPQNLPTATASIPRDRYLSPVAILPARNGHQIYVVCEDADSLLVVDTGTRKVLRRIPVGKTPRALAASPDRTKLYVSNEASDTVTELNAVTFEVIRTLRAGWGPVGLTTDRAGDFLYVANTLGNDVSVLDLKSGTEANRLEAGRFPEYVTLSRDGRRVYVSNLLARLAPPDQPPVSELTVIDTREQRVTARVAVPGVIQMRHIAELPASAGGLLLVPMMRPKNLNPLVQIQQGWYLTHGLAVIRPAIGTTEGPQDYQVAEVLLDDIDHYYADGFGVAVTPNGRQALVTASGANLVSILDTAKLRRLAFRPPTQRTEELADRLDSATHFVAQRLATGRNPTDVVVSPDGRLAYIANRMDDTIGVIDMAGMKATATIDLGGPRAISPLRHGEQLFFDASYSTQGQMACATCHPHEGLSDGLAWNLETPQLGRDVVENRTLFGIDGTSPFKWNGNNPNLETQDGPRTAMYIFRNQGFSAKEVTDLADYLLSLRLPANPRLGADRQLNSAQARGREIFFRTRTRLGTPIPPNNRCYYCHAPLTHYTSRVRMNVGTSTAYDTIRAFDVPQLEGVAMKPPYLHNGEATTLEQIWTEFNPDDKHGFTSDLTKDELNDLIEFLKTL